jgi:predicted PurR-regulated permease PerM
MMMVTPQEPDTDGASLQERPEPVTWFGLLFALGVCAVVVLMVLAPFFSVILLAVVASGLIRPAYRQLVDAFKGRRRAAAG